MFDQFVKHRLKVKYYARYTDDFVVVSDNEEYLQNVLSAMRMFLAEALKLDLHPEKISIRKYTSGIDFLGYVVLPYHIKLRTKTKRRMLRKLKEQVRGYKRGEISEIRLKASLQSYLGVLSHADAYQMSNDLKNMFWWWMSE